MTPKRSTLLLPFLAAPCVAFGQVALTRTSTVGGSTCGPGSTGVEMRTTGMRVVFDTCFGGTPRWWYLHGLPDGDANSIIYSHPGAAMSAVFDTGQDATQTSCNGITPNPIARKDGGNPHYTYYAHELEFTPPSPQHPNAVYALRGFFPFFWLSHEAIDDSLPPRANGLAQAGWATCYSRCRSSDGCVCSGRAYTGPGTPIWFDATMQDPSGIIFVGNARKPVGPIGPCGDAYKWQERVLRIREGRFACKIRVHMHQASSGGIAGILFRKDIPGGSNPRLDSAFFSRGYHLYVNRQGVLQIVRVDGSGGFPIVWNSEGAVYAPSVATPAGALIELRTHNALPGRIEVYVNDAPAGVAYVYNDSSPILGPMFGLYATDAPGNSIQFSERQVFDVGVEMVIKYTAKPDGVIESDVTAQTVQPHVSTTRPFYVNALPGAFLNPGLYAPQPLLARAEALDACGDYAAKFLCNTGCGESCSASCPCPQNPRTDSLPGGLLSPILRGSDGVFTHWVGDNAGLHGLWMTPVRAELDGGASTVAHSFIATDPNTPIAIAHIAPLEFHGQDPICSGSDCGPTSLRSLRMVTAWSAVSPELPSSPDADGDGLIDTCDDCTDTDEDGYGDPGFASNSCPPDGCPNDSEKAAPGQCGCGVLDTNSDGDAAADCTDGCPYDPAKTSEGACGCGFAEAFHPWDYDEDCSIGLPDYQMFGACLHGPSVFAVPGCLPYDLEADAVIDLREASVFQNMFGQHGQ